MIPQTFIQELLRQADIVAMIGTEIPLTQSGHNYFGYCPFHKNKKQSATMTFTVSREKNFYHCFGCGAHGSVINFFIQSQGLSFPEAVTLIASKVGLDMPGQSLKEEAASKAAQDISDVLSTALAFYQKSLRASAEAIDFLKSHGISGKTAAFYKVGYAPKDWENLQSVYGPDYEERIMTSGIGVRKGTRIYDRFRDRIMFPVFDFKNRPISFVGHRVGKGNSANQALELRNSKHAASTPVASIFGLSQARAAIRKVGCVVVTETCMDVLILHEQGFLNAVSLPGAIRSRVNSEYIQQLFRITDRILLCFPTTDQSAIAIWQTMKDALPVISEGKNIGFMALPEQRPLREILTSSSGVQDFNWLLRTADSLSDYLIQSLTLRHDISTIEGRAALMKESEELLEDVKASHLKELLQKRIKNICQDNLELLNTSDEHDRWLAHAIKTAKREVLIITPWITRQGVDRFNLCADITSAVQRGVVVTIYTDIEFNASRKANALGGDLFDEGSYAALVTSGARIIFIKKLHSKVVVCDTTSLCIGSFNWLSAVGSGKHKRHEVSIIYRQGGIDEKIAEMIQKLEARKALYPFTQ